MVNINKGNSDQNTDEEKPVHHGQSQTKLKEQQNGKNTGQGFYERISYGYRVMAELASAF